MNAAEARQISEASIPAIIEEHLSEALGAIREAAESGMFSVNLYRKLCSPEVLAALQGLGFRVETRMESTMFGRVEW